MRLEALFDKQDYNDTDLITIKVPLSLPYMASQQNFERIDGEITVDGKILKYVKRKMTDEYLILLCLPNHNKMRLESAKDDFFKYANGLVQNNQSKKSNNTKSDVFKNVLSEYCLNSSDDTPAFRNVLQTYRITSALSFLPSPYYKLPEQPPEII